MNYIGRIILAVVGFKFGGGFGAIFGYWLGLQLDRKLNLGGMMRSNASQEEKQQAFREATFLVMGHVAKADGVVSKSEIELAKQTMRRLGLNEAQRRQAQELFNHGKSDDFDLDTTLASFRNIVGPRNSLSMMFLEIQISAALGDGKIDAAEHQILLKVCSAIGVPRALFEQLVQMIAAAQNFNQQSSSGKTGGGYQQQGGGYQQYQRPSPESQLKQAYLTLGVTASDNASTIKRAYRKLMSANHPDKLQSKGLPEEMMKVAADKTHAVKQAYEVIKAARGFK